ncbi:uncharacterized protein LOC111642012 [Centruroides sculpturatus]|uniref:uncharacterized protein LOC111642012 n=1 Tax=Centruroides sculpturatus TaxID=218467 RepID=UPI000C6E93E1|nr:uncharacterized protein LOC111642012 [Centruroides sculpturatus]
MSKERHFLRPLNTRLQIILVCVLIIFTNAYEQKTVSRISKRIVGGSLANINDYPFMISNPLQLCLTIRKRYYNVGRRPKIKIEINNKTFVYKIHHKRSEVK